VSFRIAASDSYDKKQDVINVDLLVCYVNLQLIYVPHFHSIPRHGPWHLPPSFLPLQKAPFFLLLSKPDIKTSKRKVTTQCYYRNTFRGLLFGLALEKSSFILSIWALADFPTFFPGGKLPSLMTWTFSLDLRDISVKMSSSHAENKPCSNK